MHLLMKERPRKKLFLTTADKTIEFSGWFLLIVLWLFVILTYDDLSETIPVHFDKSGQADRFGSKSSIFLLPIFATIIYSGLTILNKYPHLFNYIKEITNENALNQYTNATKMIRYLKLIIVFIFGLISILTVQNESRVMDELGKWFLPLILGLIFIPIFYFYLRSIKE
jgi:uncharacterized membrane protein